MKIEAVRFSAYKATRPSPISNGRFTYRDAITCIVEVITDAGVSGLGLGVGLMVPGGERTFAPLVETFDEMLRGSDPLNNERRWDDMWIPKLFGRRGIETRVISMIDIALWDIKAKVANLPLYKLLGGYTTSVPVYVAGGYYQADKGVDDLAREMADYVALGVRAVKMKVGKLARKLDVERVAAVRAAIGPDVGLMLDANGAYSAAEAVAFSRAVEDQDIFWFEEPLPPDDYAGLRKLGLQSVVPIATGENEYTRFGFRDLLNTGGVDILNPDAEILGGVTEFMKVAALAQAHNIAVAPHGRQELHVHLVAAIPNGLIVEYYRENVDPLASVLVPQRLEITDGCISPPEAPGHGIKLDRDSAQKYRVFG